jgi:hypothetical protein
VTPGAPVCGVTAPSCSATPAFASTVVNAVKGSSVGFRGTIKALGASTEPTVPSSELPYSVIVSVDVVLAGMPGSTFLGGFVGQSITVRLAGTPTMGVGYVGYFFAQNWIDGTSLALTEVTHFDAATYPTIEKDVPAIEQIQADRKLFDRLSTASVIAMGSVGSTKPLNAPGPISEHSPEWSEGAVAASCVLKGSVGSGATLTVRYAASTDIAWFEAPKLSPAETALFVLSDDTVTGVPGPAYVVSEPMDVQSTSALTEIVALLACPPPVL